MSYMENFSVFQGRVYIDFRWFLMLINSILYFRTIYSDKKKTPILQNINYSV